MNEFAYFTSFSDSDEKMGVAYPENLNGQGRPLEICHILRWEICAQSCEFLVVKNGRIGVSRKFNEQGRPSGIRRFCT